MPQRNLRGNAEVFAGLSGGLDEPDPIPEHIPGVQAGVAYGRDDTSGRDGYVYLAANGEKLGGLYSSRERAAQYGPAFSVAQKRR